MKYVLIAGVASALWLLKLYLQDQREAHKFAAWKRHIERSEWQSGCDQACVRTWPINKLRNESRFGNAQLLRKRA